MTKTEYAQYIASEEWQQQRKKVIADTRHRCERCELPRWVASLIYDQDLHVHHRNYQNLGNEQRDDLEVLCRRCHELETFGRSDFKAIKECRCTSCEEIHYDTYSDYCPYCERLRRGHFYSWFFSLECNPKYWHGPVWQAMLRTLTLFLLYGYENVRQQAFEIIIGQIKSHGVGEFLEEERECKSNGQNTDH